MIVLLFLPFLIIERVNGESTKTSDNLRSTSTNDGIENTKERERRQVRERTSSRSRSRSPLQNHAKPEIDENNKYHRNARRSSSREYKDSNNDLEHLEKDRKSPLKDLDTTPQSRLNRSPSPSIRRSKSVSPSRVEQVEAAARYAAEHAIRIAGNHQQQYSPPSSPPKSMSPLAFLEKGRKSSSSGSTFSQKSSSLTTNPLIPTTTSKNMSQLPFLPHKESNSGLNALLSNGMGDTSISRGPPILPTNPLDSLSPGNPAGLTGALAAIQAGQSSIQQVLLNSHKNIENVDNLNAYIYILFLSSS